MKAAAWFVFIGLNVTQPGVAAGIATHTVAAESSNAAYTATGTVEAVRQATLSAQVAGRISGVFVHNGETVRAGQILIRIAAGEALDLTAANAFTAEGSAARLSSARADYERAERLRTQDFISVAAMQRAEAAWRSAEAEAHSSQAQASAAKARAEWYTIKAPFSGKLTDLRVSVGDLATPGRPLARMYDPGALRLIAHVPEMLAAKLQPASQAWLVSPSGAGAAAPAEPVDWLVIPAVDPESHSVEVRALLRPGTQLEPGQFARLTLPLQAVSMQLRIPVAAVVRRSEMTGTYVIGTDGKAHLRQLRLGPESGNEVVVLSGLQNGERVALDAAAAASL
jgi:membrane fusion protein, multidrug efflux system